MIEKVGRNEPCPCGSGKKYKQCCWTKDTTPLQKKKFTAKVISSGGPKKDEALQEAIQTEMNLMERAFGPAIEQAKESGMPPVTSNMKKYHKGKIEEKTD